MVLCSAFHVFFFYFILSLEKRHNKKNKLLHQILLKKPPTTAPPLHLAKKDTIDDRSSAKDGAMWQVNLRGSKPGIAELYEGHDGLGLGRSGVGGSWECWLSILFLYIFLLVCLCWTWFNDIQIIIFTSGPVTGVHMHPHQGDLARREADDVSSAGIPGFT